MLWFNCNPDKGSQVPGRDRAGHRCWVSGSKSQDRTLGVRRSLGVRAMWHVVEELRSDF